VKIQHGGCIQYGVGNFYIFTYKNDYKHCDGKFQPIKAVAKLKTSKKLTKRRKLQTAKI
jgi:hypothetical protein